MNFLRSVLVIAIGSFAHAGNQPSHDPTDPISEGVRVKIISNKTGIRVNQPVGLKLIAEDRHGRAIAKYLFQKDHEKFMHMLVVSEDLESFSHVHPELKTGKNGAGVFGITLNQETEEFDNQQAATALSKEGEYKVYSEIKIGGKVIETVNELQVGRSGPILGLSMSPTNLRGEINNYFTADGQPTEVDRDDARYKVSLSAKRTMKGMIHLIVDLGKWHKGHGMYMPLSKNELHKWLGMKGHATIISEGHEDFFHLHNGHHGNHGGGHGDHHIAHQGEHSMTSNKLTFMMPMGPKTVSILEKEVKMWVQFVIGKDKMMLITSPATFVLNDFLSK